jgi:hypothetical protein
MSGASSGCMYALGAGAAKMVESQEQAEAEARIQSGLQDRIRPWIGKPIDEVIAAWGEPYIVDAAAREYVWREQQRNESMITSTAVTVDLILSADERGIVTGGYGQVSDSR